ncbi:Aldehyde oxidase GLOX [Sparassis crispa]|uniref:Aldehyde oxidase GLOX n=1 Tax=Sparassis crispa TaxID=139825 RepID=A0A401GJ54_9APHY|nr:Aldehyde oxidase GLOX [Sparassis crispa]GBE82141.1 Aldehyde oxidase GLOX [Sparassis crispa]
MAHLPFFIFWTFVLLCATQAKSEPEGAWNGFVAPGSEIPSRFTPYYAPPGTKSYDSSSPLLHYSGTWSDSFSSAYVHHSIRVTSEPGASMAFTFTGTGVEWFGNQDARHGISEVYIDGKLAQRIDSWNAVSRKQQRLFWISDLLPCRHTVKILNTGERRAESKGLYMDIDAIVVTLISQAQPDQYYAPLDQDFAPAADEDLLGYSPLFDFSIYNSSPRWQLIQRGHTGVNAMQLAIVSESHAIIVDKVEHNPLTIDGHPAWAALYNLKTHEVKPLAMQSNSFCAGGAFLSNGTLINVGGNPVVEDHTSAADFGDLDGLQAIRIFEPCDTGSVEDCKMYENHVRVRMASPRWYSTVVRISDGSAMIIGGSRKGGWINNATVNNPTIEYWPPKNIHGSNGLPIHLPFLVDTLNANLFPIVFLLPDGRVFVAANQDSMIYDWQTNTEQRLPPIPNGVRVTYPMAGTAVLLPLSPQNDYAAEILLCGGSTVDDAQPGYSISSQALASAQCARLLLTNDGIAEGWHVEHMPQPRTMLDAVLLPTGAVVLINGAGTGISGYGNVRDQVGASNADNPVLVPVYYDPRAPKGQRFSTRRMPASDIPRVYHSVASLTPDGDVMIAGSNPNLDRSEVRFGTEYRVEWLSPPYMFAERPSIIAAQRSLGFGEAVEVEVQMPSSYAQGADVQVTLMDLGYVTHAVHANSRLVYLEFSLSSDGQVLTIVGPPHGAVYPPGPGWLYIVVDGIPSTGLKVMVGDGDDPPLDESALQNLLATTEVDQYKLSKKKGGKPHGSG